MMNKTFEEISNIIETMDDELFNRINENDWDGGITKERNARRRFLRALNKAGLTEDEWFLWALTE